MFDPETSDSYELGFKGELINNAEYGAQSTMTAILGRMATYSGQVVKWDDAMASDHKLVTDDLDWNSQAPVITVQNGNYPIPKPGITNPFE